MVVFGHKNVFTAVFTAFLLLTGCAPQYQPGPPKQLCVENSDSRQAMLAAETVLAKMHFIIDKADLESGIITTRPLPAGQWFEPWRSDNAGSFNTAEANLHSIRRTAAITFSEAGAQLCLNCSVAVQRLNLPEYPVSSSSQAYKMFSQSKSSAQRMRMHLEQKKEVFWMDIGQDSSLASDILSRIKKQLAAAQRENK